MKRQCNDVSHENKSSMTTRRDLTLHLCAFAIFAILASGPLATNLVAQNYLTSTGSPSFSAPYPAEMGTVDAATGNLHLEIPLGAFPQRAQSSPVVEKLAYDSHIWAPQFDVTTGTEVWGVVGTSTDNILAFRTYGTWGLEAGSSTTLELTSDQFKITNGKVTYCELDWVLTDTTGTQRYFPMVLSNPTSCPFGGTGGSAYAADSSGYYLFITNLGASNETANVYAPDGTLVYNTLQNCDNNPDPNCGFKIAEDSNGNYLFSSKNIETDIVGRAVGLTNTYDLGITSSAGTYPLGVFNSQDTTAGTSSYSVTTAIIPLKTNFQQAGITECTSNCTAEVITSILLPDNTKYTFLYDCDSTTGNTACGSPGGQIAYYGTVISMTVPTGQTITYGYSNFKDAAGNINRWITRKTTGTAVWTYTPLMTANGGWKTSYSCASGSSVDGCQQTTVVRPDGSKEATVFALNNGAWPTTITSYDTNGTTVLSTVTNSWDFTNPCTLAICDNGGATQEFGSQYVRKTATWTTLPVPSGSITKKTTYAYDSPQHGNVTALKEWGFRSGTQTTASFPTVADRTTFTQFATIGSNNNINRPTSIRVCNNMGTSDLNCAGGGTTVSLTTIAYDTYGTTNVLPLQRVSNATNHDDANFDTSYTARGNPTQISRWINGSTYLNTYTSYDTTGQKIQVLDSNLNKATYSYADNYYYDNGGDPYNWQGSGPPNYSPQTTNAYLTSVTDPAGTTTAGYYYGSGKAALTTDSNGVTTYSHYMDLFDRGTAIDRPFGWTADQYSAPPNAFHIHLQAVGDAQYILTGCVSCVGTNSTLDSLGREVSAFSSSPAGGATVSTTYDGLNRPITVSHPNFGTGDPNDVVETEHYDGLGRSTSVTHPDGQVAKTAYGAQVTTLGGLSAQKSTAYGLGFPILSVDEQGNLRQKWIDGFGNVIEVDEPSGAGGLTSANYTNYSYDALGSLTAVIEGVQTRSYAHDGLSRRTQESTPEAGTVTYSYMLGSALCSGDPSNRCTRTDARGIVTTYTYDSANRLIGKSYSSSSMPNVCTMSNGGRARVCYTYGSSATAYNIGRVATMTDPSGSETYSYDKNGRIITIAKTIGSTTYTISYAYNPGGQLIQITYPSGRKINYSYDSAGHLSTIYDSANTYVTLPTYDAAGHPLAAIYGNGVRGAAAYAPQSSELTNVSYGSGLSTAVSSISVGSNLNQCHHVCGPQGCVTTCPPASATCSVSSSAGLRIGDSVTIAGNTSWNAMWTVSSIPSGVQVNLTGAPYGGPGGTGTGGTLTDNDVVSTSFLALNYYYQRDATNCPNGNLTGNNGQIQCVKDVSTAVPSDSGRSASYTYDYLGRLSHASTTGSTQYPAWNLSETYDRYGNLSTQSGTNAPPISLSINTANNRISTTGYQYDSSGNVTATPNPGGATYVYDGEECLTGYTSASSSATYTCDGDGVRVSKAVTGAAAVTTIYIYSGGRVIAEYDNGAAVNSPTREYIYGRNLVATVTGSTGGTGGTIVYQHRDHLSPRLYTSSTGANSGEEGTFPFGETWYNNGTTSNWVFTSYERDAESGNDNALARSYANNQARFLSPDPVGGDPNNPQSWNRYAYVGNDPLNVTDPTGRFWLLDAIELIIGLATDDPALDAAALLDAGTDPSDPIEIYLVFWGSTGTVAAGILPETFAVAGSVAPFTWGGADDPGGQMGEIGRALFAPNSPYQAYWSGSEAMIKAFGENMIYSAAGGVVGHVAGEFIGNVIDGYLGTEGALVPKAPLGYEPSPVSSFAEESPASLPDEVFSSKAPMQVEPGVGSLEGQHIDDVGNVEPWKAHYDEFGRQIGRTDYNAGDPTQGIPDTHWTGYRYGANSWGYGSGAEQYANHMPGEYPGPFFF